MIDDKTVEQLLFTERSTYYHWNHILQFFDQHKTELTPYQKLLLFKKVENYRKTFSDNYNEIKRDDINPYIYDDPVIVEYEQQENTEEPRLDKVSHNK